MPHIAIKMYPGRSEELKKDSVHIDRTFLNDMKKRLVDKTSLFFVKMYEKRDIRVACILHSFVL